MECEPLALEARGHQGEENRRGTDERPNANARLMGAPHQWRPGVGDTWRARLREHRSACPDAQGREKLPERLGRGVCSEPVDGELGQRARMPDRLQEGACALRFFGDEAAQPPEHGLHARRNGIGRVGVAEQYRREVKRPRVHAGTSGDTPNSARRSTSAISGRPISAVGSVPSSWRTRTIPSASIFADPAQSYGCSARK